MSENTSQNLDVLVWRAEEIDGHGDLLTPQALQDMADRLIPGTAIPLNFDLRNPVGYLVAVWIDGKDLMATVRVTDLGIVAAIKNGRAAVRPGFELAEQHTDNGPSKRVIDHVTAAHLSVTLTPMHLPGEQDE